MKNLYIYLGLALMLVGCSSTKSLNQMSSEDFKTLIDQKEIKVDIEYASPNATSSMIALQNAGLLGNGNSAARINLQGNGNFLTIKGDSIKSHLPFYGERTNSGGYGSNNGVIKFIGAIENYVAEWNEKKNRYDIRFTANTSSENFMIYMNIYPNMRTTLAINGNARTSIGYSGRTVASND